MAGDAEKAAALKEQGNVHFTTGNFLAAESLYSKASVCSVCLSWLRCGECPSPIILAVARRSSPPSSVRHPFVELDVADRALFSLVA